MNFASGVIGPSRDNSYEGTFVPSNYLVTPYSSAAHVARTSLNRFDGRLRPFDGGQDQISTWKRLHV